MLHSQRSQKPTFILGIDIALQSLKFMMNGKRKEVSNITNPALKQLKICAARQRQIEEVVLVQNEEAPLSRSKGDEEDRFAETQHADSHQLLECRLVE